MILRLFDHDKGFKVFNQSKKILLQIQIVRLHISQTCIFTKFPHFRCTACDMSQDITFLMTNQHQVCGTDRCYQGSSPHGALLTRNPKCLLSCRCQLLDLPTFVDGHFLGCDSIFLQNVVFVILFVNEASRSPASQLTLRCSMNALANSRFFATLKDIHVATVCMQIQEDLHTLTPDLTLQQLRPNDPVSNCSNIAIHTPWLPNKIACHCSRKLCWLDHNLQTCCCLNTS